MAEATFPIPDDPYSGIVRIRKRLKTMESAGLCVETFSTYTWWHGYSWLMKRVEESEATSAGAAVAEKPKIIIYGHSLGGWATVLLSRRLATQNIPVELTVQVDSVGLTDATVPSNVKEAANYYRQAVLPPYGRHKITAKDSGATEILGNYYVAQSSICHASCSDFRLDRRNGPAPVGASGLMRPVLDKIWFFSETVTRHLPIIGVVSMGRRNTD